MFCVDETTALAKFGETPTFDAPEDGIYRPEECYRCAEKAICGATKDATLNALTCRWDPFFHECLQLCVKTPDPATTEKCASRSLCDCLKDTDCGWCQYTQTFTDPNTFDTRKVAFGLCMRKDGTNKCLASREDGGLGGNVGLERPLFCDNASRPDGFENPADICRDETIKRIITAVNSGEFTAASLQEVLTKLGITDVIIQIVGQPSSDGEKGKISLTIIILGTKDLAVYVEFLNRAIAERFGVKETNVITRLEKEDTATQRRFLQNENGVVYLQESTITPETTTPATPSSGFSFTPIWLMTLLSFLFMRI
jgi:hypothetical protein